MSAVSTSETKIRRAWSCVYVCVGVIPPSSDEEKLQSRRDSGESTNASMGV